MAIDSVEELEEALGLMRKAGTDLAQWEVKKAVGGMPASVPETVSAFANTRGGTLILGVSEDDFRPAEGFDSKKIQTAAAQAVRNSVSPEIAADIRVFVIEGAPVIVVNVPEIPARDKPCFVRKHGQVNGSFVRTGDGDHRMSLYELDRFRENQRRNAFHDVAMVEGATLAHLDNALVEGWLRRVREDSFGRTEIVADERLLANRRVAVDDGGILRPTVAGLMALGEYPQEFFPRLNVAFAVHPRSTKGDAAASVRFVDSANIDGPISRMVLETTRAVARNIRQGAVVSGGLREDVWDYPLPAIREAVANALMHRDYSVEAQGAPVSVDLYPDRLEISNPGGLYGPMTVDLLGAPGGTTSRNQFLSRILEDVPYVDVDGRQGEVVENRGTGYPIIVSELERALMDRPIVRSTLQGFTIAFRQRGATQSESRWRKRDTREAILAYLAGRESASAAQIAAAVGLSAKTVRSYLNGLLADGTVEAIGSQYSPKRRYRLP